MSLKYDLHQTERFHYDHENGGILIDVFYTERRQCWHAVATLESNIWKCTNASGETKDETIENVIKKAIEDFFKTG